MDWLADFIGKLLKAAASWVDRCIPAYHPEQWNDANGIQFNNNCYNYACDIQTNTFAQPGNAHGITLNVPDDMNCQAVSKGAVADGLVTVNCDEGCGCSKCQHQVALVISPGDDFHWYRKGPDGNWTHKPGSTPATNVDNSNNIITDPRTADRGPYTIFCGCFCVDKSVVTIS